MRQPGEDAAGLDELPQVDVLAGPMGDAQIAGAEDERGGACDVDEAVRVRPARHAQGTAGAPVTRSTSAVSCTSSGLVAGVSNASESSSSSTSTAPWACAMRSSAAVACAALTPGARRAPKRMRQPFGHGIERRAARDLERHDDGLAGERVGRGELERVERREQPPGSEHGVLAHLRARSVTASAGHVEPAADGSALDAGRLQEGALERDRIGGAQGLGERRRSLPPFSSSTESATTAGSSARSTPSARRSTSASRRAATPPFRPRIRARAAHDPRSRRRTRRPRAARPCRRAR